MKWIILSIKLYRKHLSLIPNLMPFSINFKTGQNFVWQQLKILKCRTFIESYITSTQTLQYIFCLLRRLWFYQTFSGAEIGTKESNPWALVFIAYPALPLETWTVKLFLFEENTNFHRFDDSGTNIAFFYQLVFGQNIN